MIQIQITEKNSINEFLKKGVEGLIIPDILNNYEISSSNTFNDQIIIYLTEKEEQHNG